MAKSPRPPLAETIANTPAAQSRAEALAHVARRRKVIFDDAKDGKLTTKADPESFIEDSYPDPPTMEEAKKLQATRPRVTLKKTDIDRSKRDKSAKSPTATKPKLSIVKSDKHTTD